MGARSGIAVLALHSLRAGQSRVSGVSSVSTRSSDSRMSSNARLSITTSISGLTTRPDGTSGAGRAGWSAVEHL